jgi:hypothetical protein
MGKCVAAGLLVVRLVVVGASPAAAQGVSPSSPVVRQSLDDAWWTGPLLAPPAGTLPRGHFAIVLGLYDVAGGDSNGFGSLAHLYYGLADRVMVELTPTLGFNQISNSPSSSGVGLGDVTVEAHYRLTQFHAASRIPTTSVVIQETLPIGKYDRLGDRPSDGLGSGAYTTTLALNSQTYFWLPTRRILRMSFSVSVGMSSNANLEGVSVYGTAAGFRGHASPGRTFLVDAAWEYSLTRRWALALDVFYQRNGYTSVAGSNPLDPTSAQNPQSIRLELGSSSGLGFAPAIELSWKPNLGIIFGARVIPRGHNTPPSITPLVAIGFVR